MIFIVKKYERKRLYSVVDSCLKKTVAVGVILICCTHSPAVEWRVGKNAQGEDNEKLIFM